jgi:allantoinase
VPAFDLVIRGGHLVLGDRDEAGDVGIAEGTIAALGSNLDDGVTEIDASGLHVLPGGLDAHLHFNEPGRTEWEGWATGSAALRAGGFTSCIEMPLNASPPTIDAAAFEQKREAAEASSLVDFALWGGLVPGNLGQLEALHRLGVAGFKAFMCDSGIEDFPYADTATLREGMRICAALGALVAVHAEDPSLLRAGRGGWREFVAARPAEAEWSAIERALEVAAETGCPVHVVHVSTPRGVELVAAARREGVDASCETCPHYLVLTADDIERLGGVAKCAPPLRTDADREGLWRQVADGTLGIVASDHSPSPPVMKRRDDFFLVWGGISGCQSTLQLLLEHGWHERGLALPEVVSLVTAAPARRFRLPAKGGLAVGADADLALADLDQAFDLRAEDLAYRHRQSPFLGLRHRGRIVRTLLRGDPAGRGRFLPVRR